MLAVPVFSDSSIISSKNLKHFTIILLFSCKLLFELFEYTSIIRFKHFCNNCSEGFFAKATVLSLSLNKLNPSLLLLLLSLSLILLYNPCSISIPLFIISSLKLSNTIFQRMSNPVNSSGGHII